MPVSDTNSESTEPSTSFTISPEWAIGISIVLAAIGLLFLVPIATRIPAAVSGNLETVQRTHETDIVSGARQYAAGVGYGFGPLSVTKNTDVQSTPSDVVLVGLASTGLILLIVGVFFMRITKIAVPGAEFEVAPVRSARKAITALQLKGKVPSDASETRVLATTLLTAAEGAALGRLAKTAPPALLSKIRPLDTPLTEEEIKMLTATGSPPDELWERLAEAAFKRTSD